MPTLVSIFDRPQDVVAAVTKLKGRGFDDLETYSPAPFEEIDEARLSAECVRARCSFIEK